MTRLRHFCAAFFFIILSSFSFAIESKDDKLGTVAEETAEYLSTLDLLKSQIDEAKEVKIKEAVSMLLEEGDDVAEALARDESAKVLERATLTYPYAQLVDAGYRFIIDKIPGYRRLTEAEIPKGFQKWYVRKIEDPKYEHGKGMLINIKPIAMWATVFISESEEEIVLTLRGTELRPQFYRDFFKNAKTIAEHEFGNVPEHFKRSYELARALAEKYPNKKLTITGSSLGGSLALFAGLALGSKVYAFNSLGLNKKEVDFILNQNQSAMEKADENVTLVSVVGDMVSDSSDMLPKFFVNSYFGTVLKIPYFDDTFYGYYTSTHHTSQAILKSLEAYLKSNLAKYKPYQPSNFKLNIDELTADLANDEILIINQSKKTVRFVAYSCTHSSGFGISSTYCDESMFRQPHKNFTATENMGVWPAQSKLPGFSVGIIEKPISKHLEARVGSNSVIRLPKSEKMSWPKDYFTKNYWTYVSAINESPDCSITSGSNKTYLGTPFYSGNWPTTWKTGKQLGWLLNDGDANPRVIAIQNLSSDPCSFEIRAY